MRGKFLNPEAQGYGFFGRNPAWPTSLWLVVCYPKILFYTSQDMCRISEPSTVAQGGEVDMIYTKNAVSQYAYI